MQDNVIVGIGPVFTCSRDKAFRASYFEELLKKVGDKQFPWPQTVPDEFVCTPMFLNLDPLDPGTASCHVKPVGKAYLDFLVRHILATARFLFLWLCHSLCLCLSACLSVCPSAFQLDCKNIAAASVMPRCVC